MFDLSKRGYNPHQVDGHVEALLSRVEVLENAHQHEQQRADQAEAELARLHRYLDEQNAHHEDRSGVSPLPPDFGHRIERVLRIAEQEATNARATAAREASSLMERARSDAEAHRQEIERTLEQRRSELDDETARRRRELDDRERELDEQASTARHEAEQALAEARTGAARITADAEDEAQRRREETEAYIHRRRTEAEQELQRLHGLHDGVRDDLGRLLESLSGQLPSHRGGEGTGDHAEAVDHERAAKGDSGTSENDGS